MTVRETIRDKALALGFDAVGFAPAQATAEAKGHLAEFVGRGLHGDMDWMAETAERRADPRTLWPEARSAVVVAVNYGPERDPLEGLQRRERGLVSVYAQGRDYHDVMKKRLRLLARWIHEEFTTEVKLFVDTAPVMEKPLAQAAGIGWQGKHTNLVSRGFGSWLFLGEVLTALDLEPDAPEADHCGECSRCLDACPTQAFTAPYRIDARRCISYLTIEHKGHIAAELRSAMGNRIYGCDDCLAVCPWNKFARPTRHGEFSTRAEPALLAALGRLDDAAFRQRFAGTPVRRTGRDRFLRNVLIAIGNSGDRALAAVARERLDDASPLVRAMAVWALKRLLPAAEFAMLAAGRRESDPYVAAEWTV
ncbi:MAG: tRNA epoxyqueuosine(34) reductase QueG [Alphaproteobacteria bacterium]|nr:tRNA epoxyqueuosine(34) reductase QueG [Alphaproteobacteria bacterium]